MVGVERLFGPGHFLTATGNYSDPNATKLDRPNRPWDDDDILSSERLAPDLRSVLQNSQACRNFLKAS
jgi:hypothetical protein